MTTVRPEIGLERLLSALERDLLDATDQEIREGANELGMNPTLKGSAALFGVTFTIKPSERAATLLQTQNLWFTEFGPRPRPESSSGSATGSRPRRRRRRRSKKDAPTSD